MKQFKTNDQVWIYECPCKPTQGIIKHIIAEDNFEFYIVKKENGDEKIFLEDSLFLYTEEGIEDLLKAMNEDIDYIIYNIKEIQNETNC